MTQRIYMSLGRGRDGRKVYRSLGSAELEDIAGMRDALGLPAVFDATTCTWLRKARP